ncbi:MAG: thioredoxin-disulfide reductase [Erysipelotrichaceae bacterium]|nr:thioredoxin-disulfide reductase [Erysipelotrichaceae bacterium]MBR3350601.1 thioredoxin-disulfide reductase [Erysipelotrichaceae bacterium]MBR6958078.1 thioredoxin-disulfide reductase [Erysipelotrichaceae bacterium]
MDLQYDVIIIGSGPAGLTAAIYATRANLTTAIIEGDTPGGKLTKTYEIENYPGFERISGVDLAMQMMEHGQKFGAVMEFSPVTEIDDEGEFKLVHLGDGRVLTTRAVIVATGTNERQLDLPRAKEFTGRGISYCAVCDGAFYRSKEVAVIGGGNSALEESLYLTQLVNKVNIIIRRDVFRADATVVDKVRNNPKINIITKSLPQELVIEDNAIKGLVIKNVETGELSTVDCAGIFPYMGADPATGFLKNLNILDERGYIVVNKDMETAVPGIYGAGDVTVKDLRQVVTATNDGAIAANACARYLNR